MNMIEKADKYADGKANEAITKAFAQTYLDGYRHDYNDREAPSNQTGEDFICWGFKSLCSQTWFRILRINNEHLRKKMHEEYVVDDCGV